MTLLERARAIEALNGEPDQDTKVLSVEDLRRSVRERISMEAIARMMTENPECARNEIRAACREAFAEAHWAQISLSDKAKLIEELINIVFGMGPIESLLHDDEITEIMVNGTRSIYYEKHGRLHRSDAHFESDEQVRVLIDRIIGPLGRRIDESSPMVDARLPEGHRVHAIIPPLALDGPTLTIRAFKRKTLLLGEMVEGGSFPHTVEQVLTWAVGLKKNIAVSGGTGSGKTTLLNALSCHIPPDERIITIEDSAELKFAEHPHVVRLEARPRNAEGTGEVTIRELVINALRMRPDRIIVGECRGGEALDMLQAMNTGHDGSLTTLHANSPREAIDRLVTMVRYVVDLPLEAIKAQIGNAFDLIIQTARDVDGSRFIASMVELTFDSETQQCVLTPLYERPFGSGRGSWMAQPHWLDDSMTYGLASKEEVKTWLLLTSLD